jgi:protein SCO1/2
MKIFKILSAVLLLLAIGIVYIIWKSSRPPEFGGDFNLTYEGQPWSFSANAKKLNLIYFGYAKCPDVCPLSLNYTGLAFKKLNPEELKNVRLLFLSVDQAHDDPVAVADYARNFFPDFIGLSGSKQQIDDTIKLYPASYIYEEDPKSYLGYSISHTDRLFFLDRNGIMIDSLPNPRDAETIYSKIKEHL